MKTLIISVLEKIYIGMNKTIKLTKYNRYGSFYKNEIKNRSKSLQ